MPQPTCPQPSTSPHRGRLLALLLCATVLPGCGTPGPAAQGADCADLAGSYGDHGQPSGESLARLLTGHAGPKGAVVHLDAGAKAVPVKAGATRVQLDSPSFACVAPNEIRLVHEDVSRIHAPPLIDQTRTVSYVLRGGAGKDLVLSTYSRTTASPYGLALQGPLQLESTTTWRREAP